jgi:hypothetical protein
MADDLHTLVVGREAMAWRFEVVFNAGEVADDTELAVDALDLIDQIEEQISIYRPASELSRINATAAAGWVDVSPEVWPLLVRGRELWELTGGAFDLAAGSLVRAWGFLRREGRTPDAAGRERRHRTRGLRVQHPDGTHGHVEDVRDRLGERHGHGRLARPMMHRTGELVQSLQLRKLPIHPAKGGDQLLVQERLRLRGQHPLRRFTWIHEGQPISVVVLRKRAASAVV